MHLASQVAVRPSARPRLPAAARSAAPWRLHRQQRCEDSEAFEECWVKAPACTIGAYASACSTCCGCFASAGACQERGLQRRIWRATAVHRWHVRIRLQHDCQLLRSSKRWRTGKPLKRMHTSVCICFMPGQGLSGVACTKRCAEHSNRAPVCAGKPSSDHCATSGLHCYWHASLQPLSSSGAAILPSSPAA